MTEIYFHYSNAKGALVDRRAAVVTIWRTHAPMPSLSSGHSSCGQVPKTGAAGYCTSATISGPKYWPCPLRPYWVGHIETRAMVRRPVGFTPYGGSIGSLAR